MVNVPQNIYNTVKPYSTVPAPIWESIVWFESRFNPMSVGNSSYGLFQLYVGTGSFGGQGNIALNIIKDEQGLVGQPAITYLLQHADLQARVGMPPINNAWEHLKSTFTPFDVSWWLSFCSMSGHPGGSPMDGATISYVNNFMKSVVNSNLFGIQQLGSGAGPDTVLSVQDNTWLQVLINNPPHQPCSIVWKRSCPGAKTANEGGMDLDSPNGTKVYSLGDGVVIGAGYFYHADNSPGYGVVTVRTTFPDGSVGDVYYQHLQLSTNIQLCNQTGGQLYGGIVGPSPQNQVISKGQFLGTIVVGECEIGINADWGGVWGSSHPGPWIDDPEDSIRMLMNSGGGTTNSGISLSTGNSTIDTYITDAFTKQLSAVQTLSQTPGMEGPIILFNNVQQFTPFAVPDDNSESKNWPIWGGIEQSASYPTRVMMGVIGFVLNNTMAFVIRGIFTIFALVIIFALLINLFSKVQSNETEQASKLLGAVV